MEIKDWISVGTTLLAAVIAAVVVILGWFRVSRLNRENEIAKERMKVRLDILRSVLDLIHKANFIGNGMKQDRLSQYWEELFYSLRRLNLLVSKDAGIQADLFFNAATQHKNLKDANRHLNHLEEIVVNEIKRELGITK